MSIFEHGVPMTGRGSGISTFAGLEWSTDPTGALVAVMGAPFDVGGAVRVGARYGPASIREQSMTCLRPFNRKGVSPVSLGRCIDIGDVPIIHELRENSVNAIYSRALDCLKAGAKLLTLGGDHATSLPLLRAAREVVGSPLALVHFDAHQDVVDSYYGGRVQYNNGTVFRRAVEEQLLDPTCVIQLGMNGTLFPGMFPQDSQEFGFVVLEMDTLAGMKPSEVATQVFRTVENMPVYLSFDLDVFDAAYAPGTGAPECGGLTSREGLTLLRALSGINLVAADVVEMNPLFDAANITSLLAANVAFELFTLLATSKANL